MKSSSFFKFGNEEGDKSTNWSTDVIESKMLLSFHTILRMQYTLRQDNFEVFLDISILPQKNDFSSSPWGFENPKARSCRTYSWACSSFATPLDVAVVPFPGFQGELWQVGLVPCRGPCPLGTATPEITSTPQLTNCLELVLVRCPSGDLHKGRNWSQSQQLNTLLWKLKMVRISNYIRDS